MYNMYEWCERIIAMEGMSLMPYLNEAGKVCIGAGRDLEAHPFDAFELKAMGDFVHGITPNGAKMLLRNDIKRLINHLKRRLSCFDELEKERQFALVYLSFLLKERGIRRLKGLCKAVVLGDFDKAGEECLALERAGLAPNTLKTFQFVLKTGKRFS